MKVADVDIEGDMMTVTAKLDNKEIKKFKCKKGKDGKYKKFNPDLSDNKIPSDKSELNLSKGFRALTSQIARSENWNYKKVTSNKDKRSSTDFYEIIDLNTGDVEFEVEVTLNKKGEIKSIIYIVVDTGKVIKKSKDY